MSLSIFVSHPSHFLTDCQPHGDGLLAYAYLDRLARRGHTIHVAVPLMDIRGELHPGIHLHPIQTRMRPSSDNPSALHRLEYAVRVRVLFERLRRKTRFDAIHQLNPVVSGMSMFLGSTGVPIVLGPIPPSWPSDNKARLKQFVHRRQFGAAAAIIVPTLASLAELPEDDRIRAKVRHVNYGIDSELFSPAAKPVNPNGRTILFFAYLMLRKGIFTLLSAFEQIAPALPDVRLVIAGNGPDEAEVRKAAAAHPYSDRIHMIGRVSRAQAPDLLRESTVYCLPSYGEPFGMTALEAMACGKPVVGTDAGGLGTLISAEGGRKVAPRDHAALASALLEVLSSPDLQESMGRANRATVEREFAWDRVMARWESVYQGLSRERRQVGTAAAFEVEP